MVAAVPGYFATGARFGLDWLRADARELAPADHWERIACGRLIGDLRAQQSRIAGAAVNRLPMSWCMTAVAVMTVRT